MLGKISAVLVGLVSIGLQAEPLRFQGKMVKTLSDIPIYAEAKMGKTPLFLTGAGERIKTIVFVKVHAYVIASYLEGKKKLDPENPLKGLAESKIRALHFSFLRDLSADRVKSSFQDSLKANDVPLDSPEMKKLMTALVGVKEKETLDIIGTQEPDGSERIEFSFPKKSFIATGKTIVTDFWKIWFGKPADGGLKDLKEALVGKVG